MKEDEIASVKSQVLKETRLRDQLTRKIKEIEDKKNDVEKQRESLRV
jgi:hypothetical protein